MGIGADLVQFFFVHNAHQSTQALTPKSLFEFMIAYPQYSMLGHPEFSNNLPELGLICRRLAEKGFLFPAGYSTESSLFREIYVSLGFDQNDASYGVYDFVAFGFPKIREHFSEAVRAVVVKKIIDINKGIDNQDNLKDDIGSGFLLGNPLESRFFVTARHCVLNMKEVRIPGWNPANAPLLNLWTHIDERVDLAVIQFDGDPFPGIPGFRLQNAKLLDDVLTMGYPPIPGFESVLIAETAQIAGHLKSTTGQVVGEQKSYLDRQTYFLISARVKGGNSGGPVIGWQGGVVGVISQLPAEAEGRADILGYACAIPVTTLEQVLQACSCQSNLVQSVKFQTTPYGFSTAYC